MMQIQQEIPDTETEKNRILNISKYRSKKKNSYIANERNTSMDVETFFSLILSYFCFLVPAFKPCQGRLKRRVCQWYYEREIVWKNYIRVGKSTFLLKNTSEHIQVTPNHPSCFVLVSKKGKTMSFDWIKWHKISDLVEVSKRPHILFTHHMKWKKCKWVKKTTIPMPRWVFMLAYLAVPVRFLFSLQYEQKSDE